MKTYIEKINTLAAMALLALMTVAFPACSDTKSYAELLTEENHYVNNFLADHKVILDIPADTVFITGPDAPYYRLDEDANLYMQVLDPGTKGNMVEDNEQIYFRYTMWSLAEYNHTEESLGAGTGNNTALGACWFRFNNYSMEGSYQWGAGIQQPLVYLPIDCKVKLIVKAQMGFVDLMNYVQPYLFELTYSSRK